MPPPKNKAPTKTFCGLPKPNIYDRPRYDVRKDGNQDSLQYISDFFVATKPLLTHTLYRLIPVTNILLAEFLWTTTDIPQFTVFCKQNYDSHPSVRLSDPPIEKVTAYLLRTNAICFSKRSLALGAHAARSGNRWPTRTQDTSSQRQRSASLVPCAVALS